MTTKKKAARVGGSKVTRRPRATAATNKPACTHCGRSIYALIHNTGSGTTICAGCLGDVLHFVMMNVHQYSVNRPPIETRRVEQP